MGSVTINLRRANKKGYRLLAYKIHDRGRSIELDIKTENQESIYIPAKIWDSKVGNLKITSTSYAGLTKMERADFSYDMLQLYATRIETLTHKLRAYLMCTDTQQLSERQLRADIYRSIGYVDKSNKSKTAKTQRRADGCNTLLDYYDVFIQSKKEDISAETLKQYERLRGILEAKYQDTRFTEIDNDWVEKFKVFIRGAQKFRYSYQGQEKTFAKEALSVASANNIIKNIKVLLSTAYKQGVTSIDLSVKFDKIKAVDIAVRETDYYLTLDEIRAMHQYTPMDDVCNGYKVSATTLTTAKNLFLLCCTLGQRVSDIEGGFTPDRVKEITTDEGTKKYIDIVQKKTGKSVSVLLDTPIFGDIALQIFESYNYNIPSMTGQNINKYIKVVGKQIGDSYNRLHKYQVEKNGDVLDMATPIHELLTSHDGRRSFVSVAVDQGYTPEQISTFTGHSSRDMIDLYNKLSQVRKTINAFRTNA